MKALSCLSRFFQDMSANTRVRVELLLHTRSLYDWLISFAARGSQQIPLNEMLDKLPKVSNDTKLLILKTLLSQGHIMAAPHKTPSEYHIVTTSITKEPVLRCYRNLWMSAYGLTETEGTTAFRWVLAHANGDYAENTEKTRNRIEGEIIEAVRTVTDDPELMKDNGYVKQKATELELWRTTVYKLTTEVSNCPSIIVTVAGEVYPDLTIQFTDTFRSDDTSLNPFTPWSYGLAAAI